MISIIKNKLDNFFYSSGNVDKKIYAMLLKLGLDEDMMYAIASCHDWGKCEDSDKHHLIAANHFMSDEGFKQFFSDEQRKVIKEAIEDHRASAKDDPRTIYGRIVSSADRNNLGFFFFFHGLS